MEGFILLADSPRCTEGIFETIPLLRIYPREAKLCSHQNLFTVLVASFVRSLPKLETTQSFSTAGWINKLLRHPHSGILLNNSEE